MPSPAMFLSKFLGSKPLLCTAFTTLLIAATCAATLLLAPSPARGEGKADEALAEAVAQGKALFRRAWKRGAKGCVACHIRGANKLTGRRLKSYPKYDKSLRRVVTAQEKINAMIKKKSGGAALDLGHADLTALEAYISTLK